MADQKAREKSALYPPVPLSDCLEFIRLVDSLGGKSASYDSVAKNLGLASHKTRSFLGKVSASKQYGLITTGSEVIQLTEAAKRILYPANESEAKQLLVSLFTSPPLYEKLVERYQNKAIPQTVQLSNILMNDYRIIKQVKENAAECFLQSAELLGLIQNGILLVESQEIGLTSAEAIATKPENETPHQEELLPQEPTRQLPASSASGYRSEIPTLSKLSATIFIPDGVTPKDLDYIDMYIKSMLPLFLSNLKEELQAKEVRKDA